MRLDLDAQHASAARDGLIKQLYARIFLNVVQLINAGLATKREHAYVIGLLDVFGFEVFDTNSFEQLCINYANERLHNFFLMRVFEVEIELYRMQNLQVPALNYPDNAKVIELLAKWPAISTLPDVLRVIPSIFSFPSLPPNDMAQVTAPEEESSFATKACQKLMDTMDHAVHFRSRSTIRLGIYSTINSNINRATPANF